MMKYHDLKIEKREFIIGYLVLLYNSRLRLFPGKLKSKGTVLYLVTKLFPPGVAVLDNKEGVWFKVNGQ